MEVRLLFLTVFIASSGLSKIQIGMKAIANDMNIENEVQQNLRSLFNSLSKNDMKRTGSLRYILEREAVKEQKAFDIMKENLRLAREKNAYRQRNLYKRGDIGGESTVFKRGTDGNTGTSRIVVNVSELEAGYVKHFGNDPTIRVNWEAAQLWNYEKNATKLRKFCASAHALAGKGEINVETVILRPRVLRFANPQFRAMHIVVAAYGIVGNKTVGVLERDYWYTHEPDHWYLTGGQRSNCAYFLTLNDTKTGQFILEQNICDIEIPK